MQNTGAAFSRTALTSIRRERGLSKAQLAAKAGLSRQAVDLIESGKRRPYDTTIAMLAKALGVRVGELYTADEDAA